MNLTQPNPNLINKITEYQTLLNTDQWRNRRKSIIERDGFGCKKCGKGKSVPHLKYNISFQMNDKLILDSLIYEHKSIQQIKSELHINTISIIACPDNKNLFFGIGENGILFLVDFNLLKNVPVEKFVSYYGKTELGENFQIVGIKEMNFKEVCLGIPKIVKDPILLHVHHMYYDLEKLPWEYEDIALITLCDQCHTDVHNNDEFIVYTIVNGELREIHLKLCNRCKGSGILPLYMHVENGICFRCRGAKFEELIPKYESSN